ncbi:unnamed protein product, partial [Owenia fusiformis]
DVTRVRLLLEHCADVNAKNKYGDTALLYAILNPQQSNRLLQELLDLGADVNSKDNKGQTVLMHLAKKDYLLLRDHQEDCITEYTSILLDHGAEVNIQDETGNTALLYALKDGDSDIVTLLVDYGTDLNIQYNGKTALMYAFKARHFDGFKLLVECGTNLSIQDDSGTTILMSAVQGEQLEYVELLLDHGANLSGQDTQGKSPLNSIKKSSPEGLEIYSLLYTRGAADDNYQHLMSLNKNATNDQQHEAKQKLDAWNIKSRLSLKYYARRVVYNIYSSNREGYKSSIQYLIDSGHIPADQIEYMMFEVDVKEILTIL